MIEAKNRCQGRASDDGGMFKALTDEAILAAHPELVARIDANTDKTFPLRTEHVTQISLVVLRARGEA